MGDSPHEKYKLRFYESLSCDTIHTYIPDMSRKFGTDFQCNPFQIYPLDVVEIQKNDIDVIQAAKQECIMELPVLFYYKEGLR